MKSPLPPIVGERPVEHAIALRRHAEQLDADARMQRAQPRPHVLGLPQRERRFARGDGEAARTVVSGFMGVGRPARNRAVA